VRTPTTCRPRHGRSGGYPPVGTAPFEGHDQRVADELGVDRRPHGPAGDGARPQVDDRGEMQPAFGGADLGDVGCPQPIGAGRVEVALDQVGRGDGVGFAAPPASPRMRPDQVVLAHQPGDPFTATRHAEPAQLRMHPRHPIRTSGSAVDLDDRLR
jgi:hypothetical protein